MFLDGYRRNWLENEGYSFEDKMINDLSVSVFICFSYRLWLYKVNWDCSGIFYFILFFLQKTLEEEEEEEEETEAKPDPLHQLILHFSRTALTEKT